MNRTIVGNVLGGVNYAFSPADMPTANGYAVYAADLRNIVPAHTGYATKRGGSTILNSAAAYGTYITSFHEFINSSGVSKKLCAESTKIGLYDSGSSAFSDHITGLTTGLYGQWLNYGDYAIYANGTDTPKKTDGTTGSALTTDESGLPAASCLAEWGERVWTAIGAKLIGSALRAPTDFSTATTDIGWWSGEIGSKTEPITGLASFFDMLLIGKANQIYKLVGDPITASSSFSLLPLRTKDTDSIGFTSKNAITMVGNDLLFLDGFSIKRLSGIQEYGDVESVDVLFQIKDFFRSSSGAGLDASRLHGSFFYHYKHKEQIWCSIPTGATTNFWFVIDYSNQEIRDQLGIQKYSFFPMYGLHPTSFGGVKNGYKTDIYAGCSDGYVRKFDTGTNDTSTAIDAHATWFLGYPEKYIQVQSLNMNVLYDSACTLSLYRSSSARDWKDVINSGYYTLLSTEDLTDTSWRTVSRGTQKKFDFSGETFVTVGFKIRHNTASQTFELLGCPVRHRKRFMNYPG